MEQDNEKQGRDYEASFLSQEENGKEVLLQWIGRFGGEVLLEGPSEKIALAYPVAKQTSAYFGFAHFRMNPDQAAALARELKTAGTFLRFLLVTPPCVKAKPRTMNPRGSRPAEAVEASLPSVEHKPISETLSNEDLEKKIEEILRQQ
ncbi:MAG: 30S ribosomal protein S6 [Candidatus Liptonbacteria bacterium]